MIHTNWLEPLPAVVPTLADGELRAFEAVWRTMDMKRGQGGLNANVSSVVPKPLRDELFAGYGDDDERALWLKVDGGGVGRFSDFRVRASLDFVNWRYIEVDKTPRKIWAEHKRPREEDVDMWRMTSIQHSWTTTRAPDACHGVLDLACLGYVAK